MINGDIKGLQVLESGKEGDVEGMIGKWNLWGKGNELGKWETWRRRFGKIRGKQTANLGGSERERTEGRVQMN